MSSLLPIFLDLAGREVLLIGGGASAHEKLVKLAPTGARLTVVARTFGAETLTMLRELGIEHHQRPWLATDMMKKFVVISAVDDAAEHARIAALARAAGILLNAVDAPASTDFFFGAQVQRGPLLIAISTQGLFPGVARALRLWLEEALPAKIGADLADLATLRLAARRVLPDPAERMRALKTQLSVWLQTQATNTPEPIKTEVTQ